MQSIEQVDSEGVSVAAEEVSDAMSTGQLYYSACKEGRELAILGVDSNDRDKSKTDEAVCESHDGNSREARGWQHFCLVFRALYIEMHARG